MLVLKVRPETINLPEENIRSKLDISLGKDFFGSDNTKSKSNKNKINKWDCIKLKSIFTVKGAINKMRKQPMEWEKVFANHISSKRLISKLCEELIQLNGKKTQPN